MRKNVDANNYVDVNVNVNVSVHVCGPDESHCNQHFEHYATKSLDGLVWLIANDEKNNYEQCIPVIWFKTISTH